MNNIKSPFTYDGYTVHYVKDPSRKATEFYFYKEDEFTGMALIPDRELRNCEIDDIMPMVAKRLFIDYE